MMKRESILVISYVPPYNRQGYDLASCLQAVGYKVCLLQMDGVSDFAQGTVGVKCYKPHGIFHKLIMALNFMKFAVYSLFRRKQVIVCVGKPMLLLGGIYNLLFGSKLVWYSLEYGKLGRVSKFVYNHCVSGYIDVEENRMRAIFNEYGEKKIALVCHNMPTLHSDAIKGGKLREYLSKAHPDLIDKKIVIYAGSYQGYACLDLIIDASKDFKEDMRLIVMAYGLPQELQNLSSKCIFVPPVRGDEFYDWLADANCALLPYEDACDFNVKNCSPQKLFDCYVVGVPYVASDRPIINKIIAKFPDAGVTCNFADKVEILKKIEAMIKLKPDVHDKMYALHLKELNYDKLAVEIADFVDSLPNDQ